MLGRFQVCYGGVFIGGLHRAREGLCEFSLMVLCVHSEI